MFNSLLAWLPKSSEMEEAGLAYADRLLRATQDAQRAMLCTGRELIASQARLQETWSSEQQWPNALAGAAQLAEEWQTETLDLLQQLGQIGSRTISEAVAHEHSQRQLLLEQTKLLRERILMAAPDTPEIVASAMGAWLDMFGQKSQETADINKRMTAIAETMMAITSARRRPATA
ncbi:MAG: hypothetical protein L6Q60_00590 [Rhodocyclaceae bacterium]|nr:hypothetical protein [Rhodocyclaceae bacterium]